MVLGHDLCIEQRTQDVRISEDVSFDSMLLRKATLRGLKNAGFLRPSPVQLHAIPLGKCGFDLLLEAKSGTGKTAVFTVISLEKLDLAKGVQTIILAPTREIASQISDVIIEIGSYYKGLNVAVVMGGLPVKEDIKKFSENVHIVVGSPGRLRHLIQDKHITVSAVRLLVLDEADKLMEKSFLPDINYIYSVLPKQKQVIMSSATYSEDTKLFIQKYLQKSQHICPDSNSVLLGISQKLTVVPYNSNIVKQTKHRYEELKKILNTKQFKQCLIFCNYQVRVGELHRMLSRDKWPAEQLYGQQEQTDRLDALKTLQEYKCRILVSTDLAARGIDASNVDVVINFEPPYEWETYLHRIGRAGRYGSYGTAISILSEGTEKKKFKEMLMHTNIPFDLHDLWTDDPFNLTSTDAPLENDKPPLTDSPNNNIIIENRDKSENELWKALTRCLDPKESNTEIPSFKELWQSYKLSNDSVIETFSDLMHSFQMHQEKSNNNNADNVEFKHVKVAKLPEIDIKYLDTLDTNHTKKANTQLSNISLANGDGKEYNRNERYLTESMEKEILKNDISDHKNITPNTKNEAEAISQNEFRRKENEPLLGLPGAFGKNKQDKKYNYNTDVMKFNDTDSKLVVDADVPACFRKKKNVSQERDKSFINTEGTDGGYHDTLEGENSTGLETIEHNHYESTSDNSDIDPIKQALIDAGLPTAFGKIKEKKKCTNYSSNNYKVSMKTEKSKAKQNQQKPFKIQEIHRKNVNNISSSKTFTRDSLAQKCSSVVDTTEGSDSTNEIYLDDNKNGCKYKLYDASTSTYNKTSYHHQNKSRRDAIDRLRGKQFDNWYNQLKYQTRAIQYALYIEELKKL